MLCFSDEERPVEFTWLLLSVWTVLLISAWTIASLYVHVCCRTLNTFSLRLGLWSALGYWETSTDSASVSGLQGEEGLSHLRRGRWEVVGLYLCTHESPLAAWVGAFECACTVDWSYKHPLLITLPFAPVHLCALKTTIGGHHMHRIHKAVRQ